MEKRFMPPTANRPATAARREFVSAFRVAEDGSLSLLGSRPAHGRALVLSTPTARCWCWPAIRVARWSPIRWPPTVRSATQFADPAHRSSVNAERQEGPMRTPRSSGHRASECLFPIWVPIIFPIAKSRRCGLTPTARQSGRMLAAGRGTAVPPESTMDVWHR